jgi:dihydrofolate reductase
MSISIIVAAATNNVIGKDGSLPWHLPEDLRRFRALTMGKPILMGRLTHEAIGRALPGRRNIVISRQPGYQAEGCEVFASPTLALDAAADAAEVMVIGGGRIYRQMLSVADRIYMTRVHVSPAGDAFFPALEAGQWQILENEEFAAQDDERPLGYSFEVFQRIAV